MSDKVINTVSAFGFSVGDGLVWLYPYIDVSININVSAMYLFIDLGLFILILPGKPVIVTNTNGSKWKYPAARQEMF